MWHQLIMLQSEFELDRAREEFEVLVQKMFFALILQAYVHREDLNLENHLQW